MGSLPLEIAYCFFVVEDLWLLFAIVVIACAVIGFWVAREFGRRAVAVMASCVLVALVMVWINYEVFSFNSWAAGSGWRSLIVFAPSLILGLGVWLWSGRSERHWGAGAWWVLLLVLGPGLITYVPRISVQSVPGLGSMDAVAHSTDPKFVQLLWWALASIALYVLIPVIYAKVFGQRIRGYGLSLSFVKTEVMMFLLVAPVIAVLVWLATADLRFQHMYPFYSMQPDDPNGVTKLLIFELVYGLSFVALEFFFRGFLVHAGNKVVGVHAVALMALSYCLIHLGKPLPECLSSLIGGLLLGYVSLKLKSIAVGVVAHLTMAWGTDAAVLWRSSG